MNAPTSKTLPALRQAWAEWLVAKALRRASPWLFAAPAPAAWRPGHRVLVVAPHPDDEVLGAGGTIALHRRHGDPVTVAVVSDGRRSRAGGLTPPEMARRRRLEAQAAAAALDVSDLVLLDLPEGDWHPAEARPVLAALLERSDLVYAPACVDYHPEHLQVAQLMGELVRSDHTVRTVELGVPLTPLLTTVVADIAPVRRRKAAAIACHRSQAATLAALTRTARYQARLAGLAAAEGFWELSGALYREVVRGASWGWRDTPFRAVRPGVLGDPLAFLVGRRARIRLRTQVDRGPG